MRTDTTDLPEPRGGLRERKKRETTEALRDAAVRRFKSQGYDATTVAQIAQDANVSLRTLFRYFPCKEALLYRTVAEVREHLIGGFVGRPSGEPLLVSLREVFAQQWPQNRTADDERRRLRNKLLTTHPGVARYAYELMARLEDEFAAFAAAQLGCSPDDPEPQMFVMLCNALMGRTVVAEPGEAEPLARLDDLLAALRRLVDDHASSE